MKKNQTYLLVLLSVGGFIASCGDSKKTDNTIADPAIAKGIVQRDWGAVDGKKVLLFTLTNSLGTQVKITNYGGTITSFILADNKKGKSDIVLGFDTLDRYRARSTYFGATIGRYANRIGDARFVLDGKLYNLAANNGKNHIHGGNKGFDKVVWDAAPVVDSTPTLTLTYISKDGEEGYPGNLTVQVKFTLTDNNALQIKYTAETDKPTVVNLTNHSYFNLTGNVDSTILNHSLQINSNRYSPVDSTLIPTGQLAPVQSTPFDFTQPTAIGARIQQVPGGYDHNFVLNKKDNNETPAAIVTDFASGRKLEVFTSEPGLQFYTGNFLNGSIIANKGKPIYKHAAFCLETQHFPNSPNKPAFPSVQLRPGQKYSSYTIYKVSLLP